MIDSRIDEIRSVRGELPLEVEDLEDDIAGLNTRLSNLSEDVANLETDISNKKLAIEESKSLMKKYEEQQKKVRNNESLILYQRKLNIKNWKSNFLKNASENSMLNRAKKEVIDTTQEKLDKQQQHLEHKKSELDAILKETEKEEKALISKSEEFSKTIDKHLLNAYKRIRSKVKNGLAVVSIERGASGGSFFTIPPQVQLEIATRKKITIDEHSGRILVDAALAAEEKEKISPYVCIDF